MDVEFQLLRIDAVLARQPRIQGYRLKLTYLSDYTLYVLPVTASIDPHSSQSVD